MELPTQMLSGAFLRALHLVPPFLLGFLHIKMGCMAFIMVIINLILLEMQGKFECFLRIFKINNDF